MGPDSFGATCHLSCPACIKRPTVAGPTEPLPTAPSTATSTWSRSAEAVPRRPTRPALVKIDRDPRWRDCQMHERRGKEDRKANGRWARESEHRRRFCHEARSVSVENCHSSVSLKSASGTILIFNSSIHSKVTNVATSIKVCH